MKTQSERIRELRLRLTAAQTISDGDIELLMQLEQITTRLESAGEEFLVTSLVSHRTGHGMLDVVWRGQLVQIETVKAREIGWMLLEGAAVAETESSLVRFLKDKVGLSAEKAAMMLHDFRAHREKNPASLVGHGDTH